MPTPQVFEDLPWTSEGGGTGIPFLPLAQQGASVFSTPPDAMPGATAGPGVDAPPPLAKLAMQAAAPVFSAPPEPDVVAKPSALQTQIGDTSQKLQALEHKDADPYGSPDNHPGFSGKFLHGLSVAGNVLGNTFLPGPMSMIQGTQLNRKDQEATLSQRLQGLTKQQSEMDDQTSQMRLRDAQASLASTKSDDYTQHTLTREQAEAINQPDLAGTQMTARDYAGLVKSAGNNNTSDTNNQRTNQERESGIQSRADAAANKPVQRDDHYIQIQQAKYEAAGMDPAAAYKKGYEDWVNTKMTAPGVARAGAMNAGRIVQVVNPDTQQVNYDTAGHAVRTAAEGPQSSEYQVGKALDKDFTSGTDAHTLTNIRTADKHISQLREVGNLLRNGNIEMANRIANSYAAATGEAAPLNFQLLKTALAAEIGKTTSGGVATVEETKEITKALNDANSPEQIFGVTDAAHRLMASKGEQLQYQYEQGRTGRPTFDGGNGANQRPAQAPPAGFKPKTSQGGGQSYKTTATGPGGHKIGSNDGGITWFDAQTGKAVR